MPKKEQKNIEKKLQSSDNDQLEIFEVCLPSAVAAKDESKDGVLKKLECED